MERAIYCYGWLPGRPNCHPVHTMKHIGMVEDMARAHATMLCWSMMGSGALSLPFLERQIDGEIPPQLRFHGYLNDKEFNEACLARGILPYAVVYQAQGWEFPARLGEDGRSIKEINLMRSEANAQYGLGEFTRDEHWELFGKKFADYFPEGLVNSDGERVTDLWEECATRDLYGNATHSHWVEVDGLTQTCHGMCRNNPVWRSYLKKTIEIQLDAGARAIQLDESETPICSFGFGGCFCKDCMKLFKEFLKRKALEGTLPEALSGVDLDAFDYASYMTRDFQSGQGENLVIGNRDDLLSYSVTYDERAARMPFFDITERMMRMRVPFDVRVVGDGEMVPDELHEALLNQYDLVVVPDLDTLTENQARLITRYAAAKPVFAYGRFADNLPGARPALTQAAKAVVMAEDGDFSRSVDSFARKIRAAYDACRVLDWDNDHLYAQANLVGDGVCVHLLNYAYDAEHHRSIPETVTVDVLARADRGVRVLTLDGRPLKYDILSPGPDTLMRVRVYDAPAYSALIIE